MNSYLLTLPPGVSLSPDDVAALELALRARLRLAYRYRTSTVLLFEPEGGE